MTIKDRDNDWTLLSLPFRRLLSPLNIRFDFVLCSVLDVGIRFRFIHRCKVVDQILAFRLGEFKHFGHHDTLRRARPHAERAIAAFRHVYVEFRYPQRFLFRVHRRDAEVFAGNGFHRVDRDAIHRTRARAFIAADAIIHIDIQPVARPLRKNVLVLLIRILPRNLLPPKMANNNGQPLKGRPDGAQNVSKVFSHVGCLTHEKGGAIQITIIHLPPPLHNPV